MPNSKAPAPNKEKISQKETFVISPKNVHPSLGALRQAPITGYRAESGCLVLVAPPRYPCSTVCTRRTSTVLVTWAAPRQTQSLWRAGTLLAGTSDWCSSQAWCQHRSVYVKRDHVITQPDLYFRRSTPSSRASINNIFYTHQFHAFYSLINCLHTRLIRISLARQIVEILAVENPSIHATQTALTTLSRVRFRTQQVNQ